MKQTDLVTYFFFAPHFSHYSCQAGMLQSKLYMKFLPPKPRQGESRSSVDGGILSSTISGLLGGKVLDCHITPYKVTLFIMSFPSIFPSGVNSCLSFLAQWGNDQQPGDICNFILNKRGTCSLNKISPSFWSAFQGRESSFGLGRSCSPCCWTGAALNRSALDC